VTVSRTAAQNQDPERPKNTVTITYEGANPKADFKLKFVPKPGAMPDKNDKNVGAHTRTVGLLHWTAPDDRFASGGLADEAGRPTTFCAEPMVGVTPGRTYEFSSQSVESPEAYGLPNNELGRKEANLRGTYIRELYGRHYLDARKADNPDGPLAFHTALWE